MNKVTTEWNLGNFTVALSADVTDDAFAKFANRGALHLGQRNSEVDVILGIVTVDEKGKKVRSKITRTDVPYSPTLAEKLAASFARMEVADGVPIDFDVRVTAYDREDSVSKEARDMALRSLNKHESAGDLEEWLASAAKYTGDTHGADGEFHPEAIAAVLPLARARIAEIKAQARAASL